MSVSTIDVAKPAVPRMTDDATLRLVAGDVSGLRATFAEIGADGPVIQWQPTEADLEPEPLRFLLAHWTNLKGDQVLPRKQQIDALEMQPALGYIALLDIVDGGADFRYRLFGSLIAQASGYDMTGRLLSVHRASSYIVDFYRTCYRAILLRPEPLATVHAPPSAESSTIWSRLILPFSDQPKQVDRLLVGIVPIKRKSRGFR